MLDKNIMDEIEARILESRNKEELTQEEWDREYLYKAILEMINESVLEVLKKSMGQQ